MVHLRVIAPPEQARAALELLRKSPAACHLVHLEGVAQAPRGDMILVDVPREEASVIVGDLKHLGIPESGAISVEPIEVQLSEHAERAEKAAPGVPADAVVWEEVEARTSEQTRLSGVFLVFMVLAALIVAAGIYLDQSILIVGGMVVGPEFGPIAAFCVAAVELRAKLALHSFAALAVGFPLAITAVWLASLVFRATGMTPDTFSAEDHGLARTISSPDVFSFFVAFCAGIAGMLSLSTAKSGALVGVVISVTTIPAAANVAIAFTYGEWEDWRGSMLQLVINVTGILVAGTLTLWVQRMIYRSRRIAHLKERRAGQAAEEVA
ncbi:MAG TPA: DUF389 domain-containing protein [Solirubrobacteraceae bacterium]|nr:DUF389 domain-containing protein [Solirubrobacteraceae bacterium]